MNSKIFVSTAFLATMLVSWLGLSDLSSQDPAGTADAEARAGPQQAQALRVCADPNNLPFSNRDREGFHNELAQLFAEELGFDSVSYTWWPQRRGFVRNTLRQHKCDVIFGVPEGYDILQSTRPFYRSPYVFLYRADAGFDVSSLDDPVLRELDIGVNLIGDDYMNPPPAHALGARGIVGNVHGYTVYGDYDEDSPPREIVYAVANGDVELAIVWGPVAGYWSKQQDVPLKMSALPAVDDSTGYPMAFSMSLGVRRGEKEWQARLEKVIEENQDRIDEVLKKYNVPLLPLESGAAAGSSSGDDGEAGRPGEDDDGSGGAGPLSSAPDRAAPGAPDEATADTTLASRGPPPPPKAGSPAAAPVREAERGAARDTPVSETVYNGWKWFMVYCTRCHGEFATGTTIGPNLLEAVRRQSFTRDSFVVTVMQGRVEKGMPAWNQLLDESQAKALYEYIQARTQGLTAGRPERASQSQSDSASTSDSGEGG